ncbi:hypothetical protein GCM10023185_31160 [Hymenobacter saemangeumensis]|uniref:DUF4293 family protein n=1 Tax=Hymenobacter saemangeumensis TaxID=1084522 RepID=A0ABP8IN00_9BACT
MKNFFTPRFAALAMLFILALVVLFHLLIVAGIIPYTIVWGGRLKTQEQMLRFETVSIALNLLMLAVVAVKAGLLKVRLSPAVVQAALWMMFGLFLMNTIGNLFSTNELERMVFTPLTLWLALFSLQLARDKAGEASRSR